LRAPPVADAASKKEWQRSKFEAAVSAAHKFWAPQQGGRELRSHPQGARRIRSASKSLRSKGKTSQFRVIARPQRGRGNLKVEGMASRGEAREHVAKRNTYLLQKMGFAASFRATIFRFGMTNRFVKDCRVGRTRPPRNDRIGRLDRK